MRKYLSWPCWRLKPTCRRLRPIWKEWRQKRTPYKRGFSSSWSAFGGNRKLGLLPPRRPQLTQPRLRGLGPKQVGMMRIYKVKFLSKFQTSPQFIGLPQEDIVIIFWDKFKPINLYRLRHMQGLTFKAYKDKERLVLRMVCWSCGRHWGHTRTMAVVFIRSN